MATMSAARIGAAIIGIIVEQYIQLSPTRRFSHWLGGTTIISTATAAPSRTSGAKSHKAGAPGLASGRARRNSNMSDGKANAAALTNLRSKRMVRTASAKSGLGP